MFALNDKQSLEDLVNHWFHEAFEHGNLANRPVVCYLVGLKVDLEGARTITRQEGEVRYSNDLIHPSGIHFRL